MTDNKTRLDTDQVTGMTKDTLTEYLLSLESNIQHLKGVVQLESELAGLSVVAPALVFVREKGMFYIYEGTSWSPLVEPDDGVTSTPGLKQVTKLGVIATTATPAEIRIPIPYTSDFKRPPIEVLEFVSSGADVLTTEIAFDASDKDLFEPNEYVEFDGTMHLKTKYQYEMVNEGELGVGTLFSHVIDKTKFKSIDKIEVI